MKTYEEQLKDIQAKEEKKAREEGFTSVEEYRTAQSIANRCRTYKAKIERYQRTIKEMQDYIDKHEKKG